MALVAVSSTQRRRAAYAVAALQQLTQSKTLLLVPLLAAKMLRQRRD
jgi:hypothetical protein